ncbi:NTE family protein [Lutibacter sp. Hel_I_33_5]|nr:NTE family protein [Lutibacter sp. Hel_I_33_5]
MRAKILLFFILIPMLFFGQKKQPKVGLVLSGGGAKGFAHIGVLKEIEASGIQIDYIGGTSMGAIVGGLYAAGFSASQIEHIVITTDFSDVLTGNLPRNARPFFTKEHGEKHAIKLPVIKGVIGLPKGVSKGQEVLNMLTTLLYSSGNETFSKLKIPFFCIATNVETGGQILQETGSLPLALRASASFPTLLNPVEKDGKLLIDGGIANNFPIDIMQQKGMDIIIGVDVQGRLFQKDKLKSVVAILNQVISYQMYSKNSDLKDTIDLYIQPDIFEFNVVDFNKNKELLQKGKEAGKKYRTVFNEIAKKQAHKKERKIMPFKSEKIKVDEVRVTGFKNYTPAYVLGKLNIKRGDSISHKEIAEKMPFLSATNNYERIDYEVVSKKNKNHLNFSVIENEEKANVKLGVHYDFLYKTGILANYNHKYLFIENDILSLDAILGDNLRFNLNYFVDNGFYWSYGVRSRFDHFRTNTLFNSPENPNINNINLSYTDYTTDLFAQTTFNRKFALGFGVEYKILRALTETILTNKEPTFFDKSNYVNAFAYLKLDTYDEKYFVTKGYFADIEFKWYLRSSDFLNNFNSFSQVKGKIGFATSIWDKVTFQINGEGGFSFENPVSTVFDYRLGGYNQNYVNSFVPFYGYDFGELSNSTFIKSEFNIRYQFAKNHYFSFIANYARLDSNVFRDADIFKDIKSGYAFGYSVNTFIGPIELKYTLSPDHKKNYVLFNLGFWF